MSGSILRGLFATLWLLPASFAVADGADAPLFDVYSFSASAEAEIENDQMTAVLVVQAEHQSSAELAQRINETMAWALDQVAPLDSVRSMTRDYQTWPRYERNGKRIIGWQARQSLQLQSEDFESVSEAIRILQSRLQMESLQMSVQRSTREVAENQLIVDALAAFRTRADVIRDSLARSGYRVFNVTIDTGSHGGGTYADAAPYARASSLAVESQPAISAGTSRVRVSVHGSIQLD